MVRYNHIVRIRAEGAMKWYSWIWESIQTILGCIVLLFLSEKEDGGIFKGRRVIWFKKGKFFSGTSLGYWILLPKDAGIKTTAHEHGHCLQSADWGPLYLFVQGIPSLKNNLKARTCERTHENYYKLHPEKDADNRGGVTWENGVRVYKDAHNTIYKSS
jgi:hypothetical protein